MESKNKSMNTPTHTHKPRHRTQEQIENRAENTKPLNKDRAEKCVFQELTKRE